MSVAGSSHTLTISAVREIAYTLDNVTLDDVWLCGGQSNMSGDMTTINDSSAGISGANFPEIRLMEVSQLTHGNPLREVKGLEQA